MRLEDGGLNRFDKITKISNLNPVYCRESEKIAYVANKIIESGHRRLPILDKKNKLVGIVTITDLLAAFLRKQEFSEEINTIMVRDVIFCKEDDTIDLVVQKFKFSRRGGFPIVDKNNVLVGVVSERDIVKYFANSLFGVKVEEIMTKKPFVISSDLSILDCLKAVVNTKYRRLPVLDKGKLVGIVTTIDLLEYIQKQGYKHRNLNVPLTSIARKNVFTVSADADVSEAIKVMRQKDVGGILVVSENKPEGIITERDILEEIV